ncbi:MAG: HD domain-containing phosphohydrolase [Candidatus Omnitrophota bacterium]
MKDAYQKELFQKLSEQESWISELHTFSKLLGKDTRWFIFPNTGQNYFDHKKHAIAKNRDAARLYENIINKILYRVAKTRLPQKFLCADKTWLYLIPIIRGHQIYGYTCVSRLKNEIPPPLLELFNSFTCTVIESTQKELELFKLSETIRPKTIALSTVHTIGRIISSTLEIDELLPRIARLTLQVLRAQHCQIMLLDKQKKTLIPHACVNLSGKYIKPHPIKPGQGIMGGVVKSGIIVTRLRLMCVPLVSEENIIGVIFISKIEKEQPFNIFDREILTTLSEQAVIAIKNAQLYDEQEKLTLNTIKALASILSSGAAENFGRTNLFINLAMSIGMELKLSSDEMRILYYAAILHNISQMGLPEKILKKPTKLTGKDYRIIKEQHLKGAQIIQPIGGRLKSVLPIIIHHHERYDGKGYPSGLKGDAIPLGAKILTVADAFEAMLSIRPYRRKMTLHQAVSEIVKYSGEQFDPVVVDAFVRAIKRFKNRIFKGEKNSWIWKRF